MQKSKEPKVIQKKIGANSKISAEVTYNVLVLSYRRLREVWKIFDDLFSYFSGEESFYIVLIDFLLRRDFMSERNWGKQW